MAENDAVNGNNLEEDDISWDDAEAELQQQREMIQAKAAAEERGKRQEESHQFAEMNNSQKKDVPRAMDFLMDIPLTVTVELGRTKMIIHDLLQLGQGSVVELNKLAGEPLEVFVNNKLVAKGEAVVINEKFGVRLTDIVSPVERIQQLG